MLFRKLIQIVMIFTLGFSAIVSGENKVARVVVEHWPPWQVAYDVDKRIVTGGLSVEIAREIFDRLNIKMTFKNTPWKRALRMIEVGDADFILDLIKNSERDAFMIFTIPIYVDMMMFIYSTDRFKTFEWERWEDLKSLEVGITRGYDYGEFSDAIKRYNLHTQIVTTDRQNVLKLLAGRFDITPMYYINAVSMFKEIPKTEKLRFSKKVIREAVFRFGISKKSFLATRIEEINKIIMEMKSDGTFKNIFNEFYVE